MELRKYKPYLIITILYLLLTYLGIKYMISQYPKPDVKLNNADTYHSVR
jgi:hypothetical protein